MAESASGEVGETLVLVGRSTGTYTPVIKRLCENKLVNEGGEDFVLECQDIGAAPGMQDGDSGAPVFKITNSPQTGDVRLYGIFWGSSGSEIAYSPLHQIQTGTELGSLRTCTAAIGC